MWWNVNVDVEADVVLVLVLCFDFGILNKYPKVRVLAVSVWESNDSFAF